MVKTGRIPHLSFPFSGTFPITFPFGANGDTDAIRRHYESIGLRGHTGIDFDLPVGTMVFACGNGEVIQKGDNGDFGISVTIKHTWGESICAHLKETHVMSCQQVKRGDRIGYSGATGFVTGPHLHFGIKPKVPDLKNGYAGFIDPAPYLKNRIMKQEVRIKKSIK